MSKFPQVDRFVADRVAALDSGEETTIRAFLKKYGMSWPEEQKAFWKMVKKHRAMPYYRGMPKKNPAETS